MYRRALQQEDHIIDKIVQAIYGPYNYPDPGINYDRAHALRTVILVPMMHNFCLKYKEIMPDYIRNSVTVITPQDLEALKIISAMSCIGRLRGDGRWFDDRSGICKYARRGSMIAGIAMPPKVV